MKILIPVDGSDQSNAALDFVGSRATLLGQEPDVHILNVQPALPVRVIRAVGRSEAKAYQRAQGLVADGNPGPLTYMQLESTDPSRTPRLEGR